MRQRLATVLLVAAIATLGWSLLLAVTGGFDLESVGVPIRSHNPTKPSIWGLTALALYVVMRGPRAAWAAAVQWVSATGAGLAGFRPPWRWLAFGLALAMFAFVWRFGAFVAGGSDSYGYLSQAQYWLQGVPILPQPLAADAPWPNPIQSLSPLGYRPIDQQAIVPTYAVGLPLLIAGVQWVAGYTAVFLIWPLAGAVLVLACYGLGRALGSPAAGLIAAWFMATNDILLGEVIVPMSDVPLAAALATSCYFLFRETGPAPVRAGLAAAIAVLIRPNFAGTVALMAIWLAAQPLLGSRSSWRDALRRAALFSAVAAPGFLIVALANNALYGSPFRSGYGTVENIYSWSNIAINLRRYPELVTGSLGVALVAGMVALCLPLRRLWPGVPDRSVFAGIGLVVVSVVLQYLAFEPATNAGYLRYVLACWPLLFVGAGRLMLVVGRPGWRGAAVAALVVAMGWPTVVHTARTVHGGLSEMKYPGAAAIVREHAPPNAVVLAMQHSGSVRYYAGQVTVRYDWIEPAWLDRAVAWLEGRGIHVYAVLDDWEVRIFRERFAGQSRLSALTAPAFIYQGQVVTHVYDLSTPPADRTATVVVHDTFAERIVPPASLQGTILKR